MMAREPRDAQASIRSTVRTAAGWPWPHPTFAMGEGGFPGVPSVERNVERRLRRPSHFCARIPGEHYPKGDPVEITVEINGTSHTHDVEPRTLLVHYIRDVAGLTGTNIGCDTSSCGACTVHLNGEAVKSCTMLAVQADGERITTIEGLAEGDELHPMQQAFMNCHALQCGYCTPGMVMASVSLLEENPQPSEAEVREGLEGNLCRCTGYHNIVQAVLSAAGGSQ